MTDWTTRRYPVLEVLEVHDGDTFRFLIDVGFEAAHYPWLRLNGWSCPELGSPAGEAARACTIALLGQAMTDEGLEVTTHRSAKPIAIRRFRDDRRTLTRYLADVWLPGDVHLGAELERLEHARKGARVG